VSGCGVVGGAGATLVAANSGLVGRADDAGSDVAFGTEPNWEPSAFGGDIAGAGGTAGTGRTAAAASGGGAAGGAGVVGSGLGGGAAGGGSDAACRAVPDPRAGRVGRRCRRRHLRAGGQHRSGLMRDWDGPAGVVDPQRAGTRTSNHECQQHGPGPWSPRPRRTGGHRRGRERRVVLSEWYGRAFGRDLRCQLIPPSRDIDLLAEAAIAHSAGVPIRGSWTRTGQDFGWAVSGVRPRSADAGRTGNAGDDGARGATRRAGELGGSGTGCGPTTAGKSSETGPGRTTSAEPGRGTMGWYSLAASTIDRRSPSSCPALASSFKANPPRARCIGPASHGPGRPPLPRR